SLSVTLLIASLPFVWAGTVLTLRRLRDLGWRPFWVLLFFVPVVKLILFAVLCVLKSEEQARLADPEGRVDRLLGRVLPSGTIGSALAAIIATGASALSAAWLGTSVLRNYGWALFVGLPFAMGFVSVLIYSFREKRSLWRCIVVANATVLLVGAGFLAFAMEGIICIL